MKWVNKIIAGYPRNDNDGLPINQEFTYNYQYGNKPKVHWCMELDRRWSDKHPKLPYIRVQCQSNPTKYMMYYDDYDIPEEHKCKHCHKQWLKMKNVTDNFKAYKFYQLWDIKTFVCKLDMVGFSNFELDYMLMSNQYNNETWVKEITHQFGKRVSSRDIGQMEKIRSKKDTVEFWKRYYKLNR